MSYELLSGAKHPIKMWTKNVPVEEEAKKQLREVASLPFIHDHIAVMPDVHWGRGATVGSVIATVGAVVPAAVGVDIGCGMVAVKTNLDAADLPESLHGLRLAIEAAVPHGGPGVKGSWKENTYHGIPKFIQERWGNYRNENSLHGRLVKLGEKHPTAIDIRNDSNKLCQLGTLGGGNHFCEICLDTNGAVWVVLHSGSRGIGNRIGTHFIHAAKDEMNRLGVKTPNSDLAYLSDNTELMSNYIEAVEWAQDFAKANRDMMLTSVMKVLNDYFGAKGFGPVTGIQSAINCHHNYISREFHFGQDCIVTRKGAVLASKGTLGIIPGSMGAKSFIVRGKGNPESFNSCSHGAGRAMSRGAAKRNFTVEDHCKATEGVECRKDESMLDETPGAYKDIDAVMDAQSDLVEIVATLKQVLCVKG